MSEVLFSAVPQEWETTTLAQLCARGKGSIQTGPFGSQLHASDYVTSGIPSVMPKDIGENVILEESISRISHEDAQRLSKYLITEGDIVYSRRGNVERRALVRAAQEGWLCGTGCLRVRPGDSVNSRFLSYYLGHPEVRRWIVQHAVGATMPNLNTGILGAVPVVVPPPPVQDAIAATLGALDDKIAANERMLDIGNDLCATLHWKIYSQATRKTKLGDVTNFLYGKSLPKSRRKQGDNPVYGSGGQSGTHEKALVSGPGIIIGRKGTVGSVYWSESNFFPIDTTFYVSLKSTSVSLEYLYFTLKNLNLSSMNSDSAVPGLNRSEALAKEIRVPDSESLKQFTQQARDLFTQAHARRAESRTLAELRDTLLPQLMSGKLRVKDAEKIVEDNT